MLKNRTWPYLTQVTERTPSSQSVGLLIWRDQSWRHSFQFHLPSLGPPAWHPCGHSPRISGLQSAQRTTKIPVTCFTFSRLVPDPLLREGNTSTRPFQGVPQSARFENLRHLKKETTHLVCFGVLKTRGTMKGPFWELNRNNLFSAPALQLAAVL